MTDIKVGMIYKINDTIGREKINYISDVIDFSDVRHMKYVCYD
jgi:hypothetical protein